MPYFVSVWSLVTIFRLDEFIGCSIQRARLPLAVEFALLRTHDLWYSVHEYILTCRDYSGFKFLISPYTIPEHIPRPSLLSSGTIVLGMQPLAIFRHSMKYAMAVTGLGEDAHARLRQIPNLLLVHVVLVLLPPPPPQKKFEARYYLDTYLSVHGGGGFCPGDRSLSRGASCPRGVCVHRVFLTETPLGHSEKRTVRILLECFLV